MGLGLHRHALGTSKLDDEAQDEEENRHHVTNKIDALKENPTTLQ